MIKLVSIIGARPQIIKAAALSRAIKNNFTQKIKEVIVHTGQHYDAAMSNVFFEELSIPRPDYNLGVGSGSHAAQTAAMLIGIEEILDKEKPDCLVVYGDTNSTLAGAIAASKIHIPVVHIEAGLRSKNKAMPEEINRILCDHVSTLLFSPTRTGYDNLVNEGFKENSFSTVSADHPKIYHCGDVMYDNSLYFSDLAEQKTTILNDLNLKKESYLLATIHRNNNTDEPQRLNAIFEALNEIATIYNFPIIIPLHPRTSKLLGQNLNPQTFEAVGNNKFLKLIPPVSFLEMTCLEKNSKLILTDSGGVQKEAYFFNKPCVILREQTEWIELVSCGAAQLADANRDEIINSTDYYFKNPTMQFPPLFGNGKAAEFICEEILKVFQNSKEFSQTP